MESSNKTSTAPRRPRVREVSSRFLSPLIPSSSSSVNNFTVSKCPLPKSTSFSVDFLPKAQAHTDTVINQGHQEHSSFFNDENRPEPPRGLETPLGPPNQFLGFKKRHLKFGDHQPEFLKFSDNVDPHLKTGRCKIPPRTVNPVRSRIDTPKSVLSRKSLQRSSSTGFKSTLSAATKLLQSNDFMTKGNLMNNENETSSNKVNSFADPSNRVEVTLENLDSSELSSNTETTTLALVVCESPPIPSQNSRVRSLPQYRTSMPGAGMLPNMNSRLQETGVLERTSLSGDSSKASASPCHRSLNSALSNCALNLPKTTMKSSVMSKAHSTSANIGIEHLTPLPFNNKLVTDSKKGKKASNHLEDVHNLRLLHNRYLQWRYVNAKADITLQNQTITAERCLYNATVQLSEFHDSVIAKRMEVERLKKIKRLFAIVENEMPYLLEWSNLEDEFSRSLSGVSKALQDASVRLPVVGDVRVDVNEVGEALELATHALDSMFPYIKSILSKAEDVDNAISELARITSREKVLIGECEELLVTAKLLQGKESCLRVQLIQLIRILSTK